MSCLKKLSIKHPLRAHIDEEHKRLTLLNEIHEKSNQLRLQFKIPAINPESLFYNAWQTLNTLFVVYQLLEVPFILFFPVSIEDNSQFAEGVHYMTGASIYIFIIDVIITLNTGYYVQGKLEENRQVILKNYLKTYLLLDWIPIIILIIHYVYKREIWQYISYLMILKVYEIFKFQIMVSKALRLERRALAIYTLAQLVVWMILVCHIFACIFYGTARYALEYKYSVSWLNQSSIQNDIDNLDLADQYIYAFYWSVATMLSVGYGDLTPKNPYEVLVTIFSMFVSCVLFAYIINAIWEVIHDYNENSQKFEKNLTAISRFMSDSKIERSLQSKIGSHLEHNFKVDKNRDIEAENLMISKLTPTLREQLIFDSYGAFLQKTPFFEKHFSTQFLKDLSVCIKETRFSQGEIIFSEDSPTEDEFSLYFILAGQVEIFHQRGNGFISLEKLDPGQIFGQVGFITGIDRTASAKSLNYTTVYKLSRKDFVEVMTRYEKDREVFLCQKDQVIFKGHLSAVGIDCYLCGSQNHVAKNCKQSHFIPGKKFLRRQMKATNDRDQNFIRKNRFRQRTFKVFLQLRDGKIPTIINEDLIKTEIDELPHHHLNFINPHAYKPPQESLLIHSDQQSHKNESYNQPQHDLVSNNIRIRQITDPSSPIDIDQLKQYSRYFPQWNIKAILEQLSDYTDLINRLKDT